MQRTATNFFGLVLILLTLATNANAEMLLFEKTYRCGPSGGAQGIAQMSDGGFMVSANRTVPLSTGRYSEEILLIRTAASGDTLWTRAFGDASSRCLAEAMATTPEGDIVIAGLTRPLAGGNYAAFLLCTDELGNELWRKTIGVPGHDQWATCLKVTNNHILIGGVSAVDTAKHGDAWLLKTDRTGNVVWQNTYGGTGYDDCSDIELTPEGGCMLAGRSYTYAAGNDGDAWLVKTDTAGNMIWHRSFGVSNRIDYASALTPVRVGAIISGYVFTGVKNTAQNYPGSNYGEVHLVKVDTAGTVLWDKSIVSPAGGMRREGSDIQQMPDGSFAIAGLLYDSTAIGMYAIRADAGGNVIWDTSYATLYSFYSPQALTTTNDGGFAVTGNLNLSGQEKQIFLSRFGNASSVPQVYGGTSVLCVYPNPVRGSLTIEAKGHKIYRLQLLNIAGQLVEDVLAAGKDKVVMRLSAIQSGVMMIRVQTDKGIVSRTILVAD